LFVLSVVNAYVVAILGVNLHNRCLTKKKGCTATVAKHTERANVALVVLVTLIVVGAIAFMVFGGEAVVGAGSMGSTMDMTGFRSFFNPRSARYYYGASIVPLLLTVALLTLTIFNIRAYEKCKNICARHKTAHVRRMLEWWGFVAAGFNFVFFAYNVGMGIHMQHHRAMQSRRVRYTSTPGSQMADAIGMARART